MQGSKGDFEMLFAIVCTDRPASLDLRLATRPAHLAYLTTYASRVVQGGPLLDTDGRPCGTLLLIEVEDRAAAEGFAMTGSLCQGRAVREHAHPPVPHGAAGR